MTYDENFYEGINSVATKSATRVLPLLANSINISSVLDVGCGEGAWLAVWQSLGATDIVGLDGDYVDRDRLMVEKEQFIAHDLSKFFNLNRRFDLVQSLEVAEHLPETSASDFVESLVTHGDLVLFSAAPKGQGGTHHVNEQSYNYWRVLFAKHNYVPIDYLRPLILNDKDVAQWYRYNTCLYSSQKILQSLPIDMRSCVVPPNQKLKDLSPAMYQVIKFIKCLVPKFALERYHVLRRD